MRNDEGWRLNDEGWWFLAVEGFWFMTDEQTNGQTDEQTDICECRVAFTTEKWKLLHQKWCMQNSIFQV